MYYFYYGLKKMGHDVIRCKCGNDVMEGHGDWHCEECGLYYGMVNGKYVVEKRTIKSKSSKLNKHE